MTSTDRLLDCGFCYEENGEEVHPHPECKVGGSAEGAVLAFLGPALAALLTDDVHRRQLLDIRVLLGDDDLARAWLIGMNPMLDDQSPLSFITTGCGAEALAAARDFVS